MARRLRTILSGGQTGVDRAALDVAIRLGISHGGWCPKGRWAEDGAVPDRYRLRETPSVDVAERTFWNVRDSDATVIFVASFDASAGTRLTSEKATELGRPLVAIRPDEAAEVATERLVAFLRNNRVEVLNVAGPRESEAPKLGLWAGGIFEAALRKAFDY